MSFRPSRRTNTSFSVDLERQPLWSVTWILATPPLIFWLSQGYLTVCQIQKLGGGGKHLRRQLRQHQQRDTKLACGGSCGGPPGGGATWLGPPAGGRSCIDKFSMKLEGYRLMY